jgi:hypothetical protein
MGTTTSSPEVETDAVDMLDEVTGERCGWKVLGVSVNGPCDHVGIVTYMDVITHVNNIPLNEQESSIFSLLYPNTATDLTLFSLSTLSIRKVRVTPTRNWYGEGLLGLMIRYASIENAYNECMHVLEIQPNSPASTACLRPNTDYILGTSKIAFRSYEQLDYWLNISDQIPSELLVYNSATHRIRKVWITPNSHWSGRGSLGCDVATGAKHSLPLPIRGVEGKTSTFRPVCMEQESNIHLGSTKESGLSRVQGQLFMNLAVKPIASHTHHNQNDIDSAIPILSLRVPEWEEYQSAQNPDSNLPLSPSSSPTINSTIPIVSTAMASSPANAVPTTHHP